MGFIGIVFNFEIDLFNIDRRYQKQFFVFIKKNFDIDVLSNNLKGLKHLVIFFEKKEVCSNHIIYLGQKFNFENSLFISIKNIDSVFKFEKFLIFEKSNFILSKISLYNQTLIDYKLATFWFSSRKYLLLKTELSLGSIFFNNLGEWVFNESKFINSLFEKIYFLYDLF